MYKTTNCFCTSYLISATIPAEKTLSPFDTQSEKAAHLAKYKIIQNKDKNS